MSKDVPTVEEIKEILRKKAAIKGKMVGTAPVYVEAPVVDKQKVIRIDSPPPTTEDQTRTLSPIENRIATVPELLAKADINPVEELIAAYNEKVEDPDDERHGKFVMSPGERRALMKELLKYTHPTLKSVEHIGEKDNRITVILNMPDGSRSTQQIEARGKILDA